MALLAALAGTTVLLSAGFPAGSPDRLPVLMTAVVLAVLAAGSPVRAIALFAFLFPCAGLLARLSGGHDPVTWPGVMLGGLATGWCFRFLYDFESVPQPSRPDRVLRALLAVWTLSTLLAAARAVTLWAAVRGLAGRAVNGEGLTDAVALRESLFAFAALAGGAVLYFLLRRSGEAARRAALTGALAGTAISAGAAVLQRAGILAPESRPYWRLTERVGGGAVDPNSLGMLCALLLLAALARTIAGERARVRSVTLVELLLLSGGLVLSGSRSAVLLVGLGFLLVLFARAFSRRAKLGAVAALAVIAAAGLAVTLSGGGGSAGTRIAQTFDPSLPMEYRASARPVLWEAAWRLFLRHPLVGAGTGAFGWELPDLLADVHRSIGTRDNPGSGYVQALAETGAVGFAVTVGAALALAAQAWRRARAAESDASDAAAGIAVIAFLAVLAVGSHWLAPDVALLFFLLAAASAGVGEAAESHSPRAAVAIGIGMGTLRTAAVAVYAAGVVAAILATARPEEAFRHASWIGFHDREIGPGGPFRWTRSRFGFWLTPGERIRLGLANFGPLGQPVSFEARSGRAVLYRKTLAPGGALALDLVGSGAPAAVVFRLDKSFIPRRLGVSPDSRRLGLLSTISPDAGGPR